MLVGFMRNVLNVLATCKRRQALCCLINLICVDLGPGMLCVVFIRGPGTTFRYVPSDFHQWMRIWLTAAKRITPTYLLACSHSRPLGTWHLAAFDPPTTTTTTRPVQARPIIAGQLVNSARGYSMYHVTISDTWLLSAPECHVTASAEITAR